MLEKIKKMLNKKVILVCGGKSVIDNMPLQLEYVYKDEDTDRLFIELIDTNQESILYQVYIDEIKSIELAK